MAAVAFRRRSLVRGWCLPGLLLLALARALAAADETPVRVVISQGLFQDVSVNDAQAAIKVWGRTVAAARGVAVDPVTRIVEGEAELRTALRSRQADLIGCGIEQYARLREEYRFTHLFVSAVGEQAEETYVVVARREEGRSGLNDLAGTSLAMLVSPRMALAEGWLDRELERRGQPPTRRFFGSVARQAKPTKAVLPVFFQQCAAALVTERGFSTMVELNPQIGRQLHVVIRSPAFVPLLFALVEGMESGLRDSIVRNMRDIHLLPTGRQLLNLLQGDRLQEISPAQLGESLALVRERSRAQATDGDGKPN